MPARKTAILLARVSTSRQAEDELPIESQLSAMRAHAAKLDADVVKEFVEGGVSGRKDDRDVLEQAVEYCRLMGVSYFIVWNTARFARHRALAAWTKYKMRRSGTEMVYVSQNIDTRTRGGRMLEGLFELIDEDRREEVREDTIRSMIKNAEAGHFNGGRVPYGYTTVPDGKRRKLAILEDEAIVVRRIFAECIGGMGTKAIATWLNQQGLLYRDHVWTKNTIGYLLKNWVYAGYVVFNRKERDGQRKRPAEAWIKTKSHPEIVSEADFNQVQSLIAMRAPEKERGSVRSEFLLTGLARCALCDMGMQITNGTGRGGQTYSYYHCAGALKGKGCKQRPIPADRADRVVLDQLTRELLTPERLNELAGDLAAINANFAKERAEQRAVLVRRLRVAEAKRRNLLDLLEKHGRGAPNLADISDRLRERNAEIKAIEAGLDQLERAAPTPAVDRAEIDRLSSFIGEMMERGDRRKVREFLATFVEAIVIPREGEAEVRARPDRLLMPVHSGQNWLPE